MAKVAAGITTSLDGYITGPNDGPVAASVTGVNGCTIGCSAAHEGRAGAPRLDESSRDCPVSFTLSLGNG